MHALTYTKKPLQVLREAARALKPGGTLLALTLQKHGHQKVVQPYNHANLGFTRENLEQLVEKAGLEVISCRVSAVERRTPNFAVLSVSARRPDV
jgi:ArsR family transcriptional regulator